MAENAKISSDGEIKAEVEETQSAATAAAAQPPEKEAGGGGGGGWGGWGFSPLSYLTDLQKAAAVAAEEISRNAAEVARSIADVPISAEDSEYSKEDDAEASAVEEESGDEDDKRRKEALMKLEKASEESFLSHGLKVFDNSIESFTSGAWQALGSAWKEGASLVQKLENSASNFSIQPGAAGSVAPSLIETGRAFTAKGMQVLEVVGKETMDLLIAETGMEVDKANKNSDEDQLFEEVSFDRCFYIYGGPEQLEELEALSNHYAMLFNRRKAKLSSEQKSVYDGKLKEAQSIFDLSAALEGTGAESIKGKKVEAKSDLSFDELKNLHDASVRKAAELAAGFASALAGLSPNDIIQRTAGRLDSLHSEGVHRISEMCCVAVTQLLMLGKSMISSSSKGQDQEIGEEESMKIDWPEDSVEKAKIIRMRAESMSGNVEAVFHSFTTGISDVAEAYSAAIKNAAESQEVPSQKPIQEKADTFSENLHADHNTALGKIQDGLQYLCYVVVSTSMSAA